MPQQSVSVILPAYNNQKLLAQYLPALMKALEARDGDDEVIVVDDAGQDDTGAFLEKEFPTVRFLRRESNGGFGEACNTGIAMARCPYILLLNTDVEVSIGFLEPLLKAFDQPDVFGVVPKIMRPDDPPICQSVTSYRFEGGSYRLMTDIYNKSEESLPIIYPHGACVLCDAARLREIGGVDPLYRPFYVEDVDLGYVAWKRGWRCLYEPSSMVIHNERGTILTKVGYDRKHMVMVRNTYLLIWKNVHDWRYFGGHLVLILPRGLNALIRRKDPSYLIGFMMALSRLPEVIKARRKEKKHLVRRDREIATLFNARSDSRAFLGDAGARRSGK